MRDIKFRAWSEQVGKVMIYFNLYSMVLFHKDDKIMQYTGLKDKNGKEIYEGDIVQGISNIFSHGTKSVVEYYNGSYIISLLYDQTPLQLFDLPKIYKPENYPIDIDKSNRLEEFEVIGNIYENPELLEVQDEY